MVSTQISSATIGFPRIGPNREMKKALESFWSGKSTADDLRTVAEQTERVAWLSQKDAGLDLVALDSTYYDQILDFITYLGLIPKRFQHLEPGFAQYFAMARGVNGAHALDMQKFFDTNYHYMVPELEASPAVKADWSGLLAKVERGQAVLGSDVAVPILIGPITLVSLARYPEGTDASALVGALLPAYVEVLGRLKALGVPEVQMHEPVLALGTANKLQADFESSYSQLAGVGVPLNLVVYYDDVEEDVYSWLVRLPVQAISLDFCAVPGAAHGCATAATIARLGFPEDKRLGAGIVDGRSIWRDDGTAVDLLAALRARLGPNQAIVVQSSAPLLHLPYDVRAEKNLPGELTARLAFALQKLEEIVTVAKSGSGTAPPALETFGAAFPSDEGRSGIDASKYHRSEDYATRRPKQPQFRPFPTTSIGSFPQTEQIRRARLQYKRGTISTEQYKEQIGVEIGYAIGLQDALDIDVPVHGEPERSDMVEYFGLKLDGYSFTEHGWVQSYGSRYVRPPIVSGDVTRAGPMTVHEYRLAQAVTARPVKGMLTGPVTMLNWSFPRKDVARSVQAFQIALALRQEMEDLEGAGCRIVQVDEPALREGLPLKERRWARYLDWAVDAFKLSVAGAKPETQVVTHLCYSSFEDILPAIDAMDADVLTIENSRSDNEMVLALASAGYARDIGPGVYDVHSPVVPSVEFLVDKLRSFSGTGILGGDARRIWVNPDCGLKTRRWAEVLPSLRNMVQAAAILRAEVEGAEGKQQGAKAAAQPQAQAHGPSHACTGCH
ncbi:METE1 [Auxenochlorella protothecoides x Auxenochlorella symbiontica]